MLILILGDCHGRLDLVHQACIQAQQLWGIQAAIQVGDFGFFPSVLPPFLHEMGRFPLPLHVIDGNHEDHGWLLACRRDGTLAQWSQADLHVHARGTTMILGGACIGFLGGALNADRRQEWSGRRLTGSSSIPSRRAPIPKRPAWSNWVNDGDVERSLTAFTQDPPDLMVTHSCPGGIGIGMHGALALAEDAARFITAAGHDSGPGDDCGEGGLTRLWQRLAVRPAHWVFGHFHRLHERQVGQTRFLCVGSTDSSDGHDGIRAVLYDTQRRTLAVDPRVVIALEPPRQRR